MTAAGKPQLKSARKGEVKHRDLICEDHDKDLCDKCHTKKVFEQIRLKMKKVA